MNRNRVITAGQIRLLLVLSGLLLVWIVFAKLIVPPVIESAYRGESWPFLNRMILGRHLNPVSFYLEKWDTVAGRCLVGLLLLWPVALILSSPAFFRKFVGERRQEPRAKTSEPNNNRFITRVRSACCSFSWASRWRGSCSQS